MEKLKVAIIGCGHIANGKHMPSLAKIEEIEMIAFCDIVIERAEKAATDFGVPGAKAYTDFKQMIDTEKPDIVHVCTPNREHAPVSIYAMEHDCHVMCEKPMAKTYEEAKAMLDAHLRTGKKLTIGYQNRHKPDIQYIKRACLNGELGEIYYAKSHAVRRRAVPTWGVFLDEDAQGGGPLIDIGTHALDLTLWCMDNYKPKSVSGSVFKKLGDLKESGNVWGDWDPEEYTVEDSAFGFIKMENGATIVLESSWALNTMDVKEAKCTLCGTKAGADMECGARLNYSKFGKLVEEVPDLSTGGVDYNEGSAVDPAYMEARRWIDAVINNTEPYVKPEEALCVTRILEAIYESAKTGKEVVFND